jgi:transposase
VPTKRKKLRQIPQNIPRVTTLSEPTLAQKICAQCGLQKKHIGCESSEVLEWEPGGFRVEVTEQQKYACRGCEGEIVIGKGPDRVLDKAMPGPGLLAEIVVRKIKDHCPLERQSRIFGSDLACRCRRPPSEIGWRERLMCWSRLPSDCARGDCRVRT